ncbi:MAG: restriction endonuclease [Proteobacteria bacterium]|nr:restriction endonuclease [Pseudomonadota bacterium]
MKSNASRFYAGDVLYGRLRPYLNKVAQPNFDGLASAEFIVFPNNQLLQTDFLKYRLNALDFVRFSSHLNEGDRPRVSFDQIGNFQLLIPPIKEQSRIVAKIEELFSELDKGIESLKTAREQLKIYRQAVLKHAFEGKLTAQWREEHKNNLEIADELLVHIKRERDNQIKKFGKTRVKNPREFTDENFDWLSDLPDEWGWERLGWITCGVEYGTSAKSREIGDIPVLRMGNIQNMRFDWADLVYTSNKEEIEKYLLQAGDVLFNRTNSPELVGKTALYRGEKPAIFAGYLIRINHLDGMVDSQYLNLFLNSHIAKQYGNRVKTDGVNQSNINGEKLINYPFPYCTLEEQKQVVAILDERLSVIDQTENDILYQLQKAEALRQSILKRAFSGKLVAQNPNDEPASVLLERIKGEKDDSKKKRNVA